MPSASAGSSFCRPWLLNGEVGLLGHSRPPAVSSLQLEKRPPAPRRVGPAAGPTRKPASATRPLPPGSVGQYYSLRPRQRVLTGMQSPESIYPPVPNDPRARRSFRIYDRMDHCRARVRGESSAAASPGSTVVGRQTKFGSGAPKPVCTPRALEGRAGRFACSPTSPREGVT